MLPPEQRQLVFLGAKSGVASSGFPSHHPQTPAAAKRRPEDPPQEVQSMYVPVRELWEKQNSSNVEHSVPARAGSHSQKEGEGLRSPQPPTHEAPVGID